MEYEVGTVLEGKVTSITKFGAFVALEGGKSGLVHISEIANAYVNEKAVGRAMKIRLAEGRNLPRNQNLAELLRAGGRGG